MVINRWSDDIEAPWNETVYIGYAGNPSEETWTMKDGTHIKVGDMSDEHVYNCYNMVKNSDRLFWSQVFKAEMEKRTAKIIENSPLIEKIDFTCNFEDTEMSKIADEIQKTISDAYTEKLRADERKIEEVLRENGWCKAEDLIDEIELATRKMKMKTLDRWNLEDLFIEFRNKYKGGKNSGTV